MKFTINREVLLKPLQQVAGVVERRQTLPVLSNILMVVDGNSLSMTGTDLELELIATITLEGEVEGGEITVPAKKFVDICKSLPANAEVSILQDDQKIILKSGRSRFSLATLPATEFPNLEETASTLNFTIGQKSLKHLVDSTSFSMAQQDVRYYLNGMLLEVTPKGVRSVATDGHRLSMCDVDALVDGVGDDGSQVIVPRKGILELARLFGDGDSDVKVTIGTSHLKASLDGLSFTSKLVDGKFPDYDRVLPKGGDKDVNADKEALKQALSRAAILSNEKYRGVRVLLTENSIRILANNPEQEEAEEEVTIEYTGDSLEIGFNVSYLLDVMNCIPGDKVNITLGDGNSSALITDKDDSSAVYVVMPMRL